MTSSRFFSAVALAAAAMASGFATDASAQSRRLQDTCDQICFNRPNAQCYQACFASKGGGIAISAPKRPPVSPPPTTATPIPPARPVQAVSVQSDWRSAVYNTNGPSRGGSGGGNSGGGGGNGGGGGGKGK